MGPSDWDDPRLLKIGRDYSAEAYELADELHSLGADAAQLLKNWRDLDMDRPRSIAIPPMFADALMAILLSMPRLNERKGALGENVVPLKRR
jgi:hypothetical protein